jgi:multiple sugar transport system substrate-binding protein
MLEKIIIFMGGKMKKLIIILTLFISSVASAGTLIVNSNQSGAEAAAALKEYIADFEAAHPDVKVVLNEFESESYKVAIRNFLTSETPDVALWFAGNRMKFFVDQDLFRDVSDVWEEYGLYDSMASSRLSVTVDDKQYGVPWGYYQWGMYYRTDIFDKVGLSVPTNFEELVAACSTLRENNITPVAIGTRYLWTAAGWFDYLNMRINGYEFHMDLAAGKVSYEDSRLDMVFDKWAELINADCYLEDHASFGWEDGLTPMINGEAAMYLLGNFITGNLNTAGVLDHIDYFQFPKIVDGVPLSEDAPTDTIHIPAGAKNIEDAKKFLGFLSNPEAATKWANARSFLSPNSNAEPPSDRFQLKGVNVLNNAYGIAQFFDRDANPDMAKTAMEGFQEFMVKPDREAKIRARVEKERERIHGPL